MEQKKGAQSRAQCVQSPRELSKAVVKAVCRVCLGLSRLPSVFPVFVGEGLGKYPSVYHIGRSQSRSSELEARVGKTTGLLCRQKASR